MSLLAAGCPAVQACCPYGRATLLHLVPGQPRVYVLWPRSPLHAASGLETLLIVLANSLSLPRLHAALKLSCSCLCCARVGCLEVPQCKQALLSCLP